MAYSYNYSSTVNHWRAYVGIEHYKTTGDRVYYNTRGGIEAVRWGFKISSGISCSVAATSWNTYSYSGGFTSPSGGNGWKDFFLYTGDNGYWWSRTHAARTVTVTVTVTNSSGYMNGTASVSYSLTIPAKESYAVSYDANGGSGAPSSQTKWYGESLTLSSTKPTRAGHTFQGWSTSASGSASYQPGATYTGNAALTLYAVWKADTYAVTYNANGGSGAPASQTKTYGVSLTLSSTRPTRSGYNFIGWATSASGSASYQPGATYTGNAALALYAVWKLAYVAPTVSGLSAYRSDSEGSHADEGTYIHASCSWTVDTSLSASNVATSVAVAYKQASSSSWSTAATSSPNAASGSVSLTFGGGSVDTESAYDVRVTVADSGGSASASTRVSVAYYTMDVLEGGHGVAFGAPCTETGMNVSMPSTVQLGDGANGAWLNAKSKFDSVPLHKSTPYKVDGSRFDPILAGRDTSGNVWALGQGGTQSVGLYGYLADRTANGTDWRASVNTLTGQLSLSTPLPVSSGGTGVTTDAALALKAYPVGAVYISYVSTSPSSLFGGDWEQITNRVLRAANNVGTGGSDTHTHGSSSLAALANFTSGSSNGAVYLRGTRWTSQNRNTNNGAWSSSAVDQYNGLAVQGSTDSASSLPAYQNLYVWRRKA